MGLLLTGSWRDASSSGCLPAVGTPIHGYLTARLNHRKATQPNFLLVIFVAKQRQGCVDFTSDIASGLPVTALVKALSSARAEPPLRLGYERIELDIKSDLVPPRSKLQWHNNSELLYFAVADLGHLSSFTHSQPQSFNHAE